MPGSVLEYKMTVKAGTTDKAKKAAVKENIKQ